jgi:DNA polymerase-3 subunit delta
MKLPANDVEKFIKNPSSEFQAVLLYGPNSDLVTIRARELENVIIAGDTLRKSGFNFNQVKATPEILFEACFSFCFSPGRKFIKVSEVNGVLTQDLQKLLKTLPADCFVVFLSDDLPPSSTIRKFFETEKNTVSVPCYKEEALSVRKMIEKKFKEENFTWEDGVVELIENNLAGYNLLINNELEKIIIYMGKNKHITHVDIKNCISSSLEPNFDELCSAVAEANIVKARKILNQLFAEGTNVVTVTRAISRYFLRLYLVKIEIEKGANGNAAMSLLSPPVFFKHVNNFLNQVGKWSSTKLAFTLKELLTLESNCKTTGWPDKLSLEDFIVKTTRLIKAN